MSKVKITIVKSQCRAGYLKAGDTFVADDLCPPICHELWHTIYPSVYTLLNDGTLDYGDHRAKCFDAKCPDQNRVWVHGEVIDE